MGGPTGPVSIGVIGGRARQLVVWLHVVSSVGWMSQAVALLALVSASAVADTGTTKVASAWADVVVGSLLGHPVPVTCIVVLVVVRVVRARSAPARPQSVSASSRP